MSEDPWLVYRETVPDHVRQHLKEKILEAAIDGFEDFLDVTVAITAEILSGNIHPEIAKEARSYLELALTAVTAKAMQDNGRPRESTNTRLAAVRKKRGKLPAPRPEITLDVTFDDKETILAKPAPWEAYNEDA